MGISITSEAIRGGFRLWWGLVGAAVLLALMLLVGPYSAHIAFPPDEGFSWYYWQRPDPDFWSRFTSWGFYTLHQVSLWSLIWVAQRDRPAYARGLHPINVAAIGINVFFVLMHILQTKVWYDGLAQDMSVFSSQASVILLLVLILIMENDRRGMLFGTRVPISKSVVQTVRRYHGYYFSWAIIYTFWFHPIETNPGHMLGNAYILMLLLQGSLFFTRAHTNRYWTAALETMVLVHGAMVAYLSDIQSASMFIFGFLAIFVITQMHGLGLSKKIRWVTGIAVIVSALIWYRGDWAVMAQHIGSIPLIEYVVAFVLSGLIWLVLRAFRKA